MNCYHGGSEQTRKDGKTRNGKQRYGCGGCGGSVREDPDAPGYTETANAQIRRAYQERTSLRALTRIFGVSRNTVSAWLKKSPEFAALGGHAGSGPALGSLGAG